MSSAREIEGLARRVNDALSGLQSKHDFFSRQVYQTDRWWEGEPHKVFREAYQEISFELNQEFKLISSLGGKLRKLASEVRSADNARKHKGK